MSQPLESLLESLKGYLEMGVENATTLTPEHYKSEELYELEIEKIWKRNWLCVAHINEFAEPGDYLCVELIGEPIVIVKGQDHEIRALTSVCRHRFMPITTHGQRGKLKQLTCPYHRWTYGLDGQLTSALHMEKNTCFNTNEVKLPEFRLEIWNNFVFVNLDDDAEPLAPKLVELEKHFQPQLAETGNNWGLTEIYDKTWPCNWKASNENSLESYHHMGVHLGTLELYAPTANIQNVEYGEWYSHYEVPYDMERETAQQMVTAGGWKPGVMGKDEPTLQIAFIPPANAFTISPGNVGYYTMWPTAGDETRVWCGSVSQPQGDRDVVRRLADNANADGNFVERVMDEDGTAMPGIERSLKSAKVETGKLSWMEEPIIRWYQWLARQLT